MAVEIFLFFLIFLNTSDAPVSGYGLKIRKVMFKKIKK